MRRHRVQLGIGLLFLIAILIYLPSINEQGLLGRGMAGAGDLFIFNSLKGSMKPLDEPIRPSEDSNSPVIQPQFAYPLGLCLPRSSSHRKTAFMGVYSTAKDFHRRSLIRLTYLRDKPEDIDLYFIIGQPETEMHQTLVSLDMSRYGDIIVLNITENLTEGTTYEFFKTIGTLFRDGDYTFVAKVDSDAWCDLPNCGTHLRELISQKKSTGTYFGRAIGNFMAGMGYVLSWDLVLWIGTDEYPLSHQQGFEDELVAEWLRQSGKEHFISDDDNLYDSPDYGAGWAQNYTEKTFACPSIETGRLVSQSSETLSSSIETCNQILFMKSMNQIMNGEQYLTMYP